MEITLNFKSFDLPEGLVQTLEHLNITVPTPVQEKAIPLALAGSDILATAQTGTGKTLAYLLPIVTKMKDNVREQALILAPTRELAEQIANALVALLGSKGRHDVALLIGGAPIFKQFMMLKKRPRFIIGTPGRIIDHLERGRLTLESVRYLVLDEMDRMLDMGFTEALETIMQDIPKERQTLMFSATLPPNIAKLSQKYLNKPEKIKIGQVHQAAVQIKQEMVKIASKDRFTHLVRELDAREGTVIVFVRTKDEADILAGKLQDRDHKADAIHGNLRQRQRQAVIRAFREGAIRIMVATDIAARGLDIPHIKHVVNYDLPQCAEDYIHRIGRTGRAGMEGFALSFVLPSEGNKWKAIQRLLNSDPSSAYTGDNQGGGDDWGRGRGRPSARRGNNGDRRPYERAPGGSRGRSFEGRGRRPEGESTERRRPSGEGRFSEGRRAPREDARSTMTERPRFGDASRRNNREDSRSSERPRFGDDARRGREDSRTERAPRFSDEGRRHSREDNRTSERRSPRFAEEGRRGREAAPRTRGAEERRPRGEGRTSIAVPTGERAAKSPSSARAVSVRVRKPNEKRAPRAERPVHIS